MPIRRNLLIGGIIRHGKLIIPRGNDTFKAGDRVIVVANQVPLKDISDLFEEDRHE